MTQEDKELLLKDLCARLPYGVIVDIKYNKEHGSSDRLRICSEGSLKLNTDLIGLYIEEEIQLKPYFRSMSTMTEEEFKEYRMFIDYSYNDFTSESTPCVYINKVNDYIDWLNTHHFDYKGLIENGLALEAPEGMYNIKEK